MNSQKAKRFSLLALHLVVPALILVFIVAAGESAAKMWVLRKDSKWKKLEEGLELRAVEIDWRRKQGDSAVILNLKLTAVRFDPLRFGMAAAFNPVKDGKGLAEVATENKAVAVSNGGYFGKQNEPATLLISDGKKLGGLSAKLPDCGVFTLDEKGRAAVRLLKELKAPYKGIDFAVQNSPLLVYERKVSFREKKPVTHRNRRTAIGVDAGGRVVLLVCDAGVALGEFGEILAASEKLGGFGLKRAVNLDGGASSGLAVNHEKESRHVKAERTIPYVLLVKRREQPLKPEEKKSVESPQVKFVPVRPPLPEKDAGAGENQ